MKKRIISLILVLVMAVLTLSSCGGYSFAKSDLSSFATMTDEDKAALLAKLENIIIKDGDFTTDPATRETKVMDTIYAAFANVAKNGEKLTTGTPGARDLLYYCYYVTADFKVSEESSEVVTALLYTSYMKQSSALSFQLGASTIADDAVKSAIANAIASFDFTDKAYSSVTSGKALEGQVAYVTYTISYTPDGATTPTNVTYTNQPIVIGAPAAEGADPTNFASFLSGQSIATKLDKKPVFTEEGKGEVTYSNITINWIAKGDEAISFKDVTYTETTKVNDVSGTSRDLKNVELTYHIYPVSYQSVAEFSAKNLFDEILGKDITAEIIYGVLFGQEYTGLDEKEDADKIAERTEWLKSYKVGEEALEAVITKLATLYKEIGEAETARDKAEEALTKAKDAEETAKTKVETAGENATQAEKDALTKATEAREKAETALESAQKLVDEKKAAKEEKLTAIFAVEVDGKTVDTRVEAGYKTITYEYLEEQYNEEIRMKLATEVYFFLENAIKVTGAPEEAVEITYDQLIQNYKYTFYNETNSDTKKTYYSENNGSFKKFLVKIVTKDIKTVKTYDEALAAIKEKAVEYVQPIVRIYVASKAFGVLATDKDFEEYKKDPDNNYSYMEYYYGASSVRHAYQFDKLMNEVFLAFEEKTAEEADAYGYKATTYEYSKLTFVFGDTPASEKTESSTDGN